MSASQGLFQLTLIWSFLLLMAVFYLAAWHFSRFQYRKLARAVGRWAARSGYKILQFDLVDGVTSFCSQFGIGGVPRVGRYQQLYHIRAVTIEPTAGEMTLEEKDGRFEMVAETVPAGVHKEGFLFFGYPDVPCFSASRGPFEVRWIRPVTQDPMWDEAVDR